MTSEKGCRKDKNQNIQVFVRLRPLNQRERDIKSFGVVEVLHNREVVVRQTHTKKFTFDRAFAPNASQVEVYQEVVSPLIEEVLAGYNCTVFAYGQTGTGKTHTMVGENTTDGDTNWQNDPMAGIIPRALSQLFDELRISNTEYTVRVSYLELYNEELFDLLSSSEDNSKLRIYEDVTRKGSNIVNGLEEITVYNKNEVYKIMSQGQERKRVASTLMNAQSSRSHTVFTIVVHMKENSPEGEELVKIGKLNLVDLAGSENISKAGSDNPAKKERARECVNINQSLLTLGRVITALVERHPHIPYRESKLTRILQESLGGRTKTSIIATISPGHKDLEETMSTLEYANRAKNIQNKPEINQKMTKKAILKEYAEEIDRLKRDLQATRDRNGVYLANETFTELTLKQEEQRKEIQELLLKKRAMEEKQESMLRLFTDLQGTLDKRISELNATKSKLSNTKSRLANTNNMLHSTKLQVEEQAFLVERQRATEAALTNQARDLLATADTATEHVNCLHDTVEKRKTVESTNLQITRTYREQSSEHRARITSTAERFTQSLVEDLNKLHNDLERFTSESCESLQDNKKKLEELVQNILETINEIKSLSNESQAKLAETTESHRGQVKSAVENQSTKLQTALAALVHSVGNCVQSAQNQNVAESVGKFVDQWYCGAVARVSSLRGALAGLARRAGERGAARGERARARREGRRARGDAGREDIAACIAEIEEEKAQIQSRLMQQTSEIELERQETENRLQQWMEEERRMFELRLQAHVDSERAAMELRLSKKVADIEAERALVESRMARHVERQLLILRAHAEEDQLAEQELGEEEADIQETADQLNMYGKEFDEGTSAISVDMEVFSQNVVEVVRHIYTELLDTLLRAKEQIESDSASMCTQAAAAGQQLLEHSDSALAQLLHGSKEFVDTLITNVEANAISTVSTLTSVSGGTSDVLSRSHSAAAAHADRARDICSHAAHFEEELREAVASHGELEGRCLEEEYRLYSPTGKTPSRREYRYPRELAATSPHERILHRLRAKRSGDDDECIVVESEPETQQGSDCDSTLSEDSALFAAPSPLFAAPSPPGPLVPNGPLVSNNGPRATNGRLGPNDPFGPSPRPQANHPVGIMKCTSETDIYTIKRNQDNQGKENAERSMCYKKSKLPAPTSLKKPLVERNGMH